MQVPASGVVMSSSSQGQGTSPNGNGGPGPDTEAAMKEVASMRQQCQSYEMQL